ncbi:kinase-like domain-containing protein [Phanerochaete sordida]|uniref:Kinase-like domain-containing protein n=1 Tax=Phanerochaete sordida TaxID=48140 RepID=A0A9P3GDV9_9APHY|nr:kinase-like domain-containing protein [Phanerochaete sordida]
MQPGNDDAQAFFAARREELRQGDQWKLESKEERWRDKQPFLASRGYSLRPRFHPGWRPSWELHQDPDPRDFEDYWPLPFRNNIIDATRDSDGLVVCIKRVQTGSSEIEIGRYFSSPSVREDAHNHCIPILDTFQDDTDPAISYIVMPFLKKISQPPFEIVDEVLDFVEQVLEGLAFMHEHDVAHRDAAETNILMDARPLYPQGFHPAYPHRLPLPNWDKPSTSYTRLSAPGPVRYYFSDFGMSTRFSPGGPRLVTGELGAERDVPELSSTTPYDPFKVDVFVLGKVFKDQIHDKYFRVGFLGPLIAEMMQRSPSDRPSAQEALQQWRHIRARMWLIQRACRLRGRDESLVYAIIFDVLSFIKVIYMLTKRFTGWSLSWLGMLFT